MTIEKAQSIMNQLQELEFPRSMAKARQIPLLKVVNKDEWRKLTDAEKCAAGVFHNILGDDMKIPYDVLPSHNEGWRDGLHFANELTKWVVQYENEVARPSEATNHYVSVYVDAAVSALPDFVRITLRKTLAADMNDIMMQSLKYVEGFNGFWFQNN
ncbi:Mycophenolic acid synthesis protein B [Colletotrichum sp. SAR11_59]|nr:Mycophenolic acid synthesis protein B [Colletotrichum sp. SAR11_59]